MTRENANVSGLFFHIHPLSVFDNEREILFNGMSVLVDGSLSLTLSRKVLQGRPTLPHLLPVLMKVFRLAGNPHFSYEIPGNEKGVVDACCRRVRIFILTIFFFESFDKGLDFWVWTPRPK